MEFNIKFKDKSKWHKKFIIFRWLYKGKKNKLVFFEPYMCRRNNSGVWLYISTVDYVTGRLENNDMDRMSMWSCFNTIGLIIILCFLLPIIILIKASL